MNTKDISNIISEIDPEIIESGLKERFRCLELPQKEKNKGRLKICIIAACICMLVLSLTVCSFLLKKPGENNSSAYWSASTSSAIGEKTLASPFFIHLDTKENAYSTDEEVILLVSVGHGIPSNSCYWEVCKDKEYKVVFEVTEGNELNPTDITLIDNNEMTLDGFPGPEYYAKGPKPFFALPVMFELKVPAVLLKGITRGTIRAQIVEKSVDKSEVKGFQGVVYFVNNGDRIVFDLDTWDDEAMKCYG